MTAEAPAVELRGVTVRYRDVTALEDVDLVLPPGEACGLVGMNGSGKSSLLRVCAGLVRPVAGSVRVLGRAPEVTRRDGLIGHVPQADAIDPDFPLLVSDVVLQGRYPRMGGRRRPSAADRAAVEDALHRVGMTELAGRRIGRLSGGQRQRVLVARVLAQEARVLLLDEPFTGLDVGSAAAVTTVLQEVVRAGGTVLVSTHDLRTLPDLCRSAVLLQRRVLAHGPAEQVLTARTLATAFGLEDGGGAWTP